MGTANKGGDTVTQPQPPYLAPYPARFTSEQVSARYEHRRGVRCPCGHSYAAHHILGGDCTTKVEGSLWKPCSCVQFSGELDD